MSIALTLSYTLWYTVLYSMMRVPYSKGRTGLVNLRSLLATVYSSADHRESSTSLSPVSCFIQYVRFYLSLRFRLMPN